MIDSFFTGRHGDWIQLVSGEPFWPLDAQPEEVHVEDIAWALSMQCRFGGHCKTFYSVAEHSVMVSRLVPSKLALWGLLHDATEAYMVDLPRPIKQNMPDYKKHEDALADVISQRFSLDPLMPPEVKQADALILTVERAQLMSKSKLEWGYPAQTDLKQPSPALNLMLPQWDPATARAEFLRRFYDLTA